jgi:hypothetical protein
VFLGEVRLLRGRLEVFVAYGLLDLDRALPGSQPSRNAAVTKVVLTEL